MVSFQPNKLGQLYVKWYIKSQILIYVSACSVGRKTYCTKYTLCTASMYYYCWLTSSFLFRFSSRFRHPQMFHRWWLLTMMKPTVLLTCFFPWYSWRGFSRKVLVCALFKCLPALGILNSSMPPTLPHEPTKFTYRSKSFDGKFIIDHFFLGKYRESERIRKEYAGMDYWHVFFICDSWRGFFQEISRVCFV